VTVNGVRFAFLGYDDVSRHTNAGPDTPGTAPLEEESLEEDIAAARSEADVVVLLPQWGVEYTPNPTARQRRIAEQALAAGVTLVAGNHPHVVQAAGPAGDGYVAFALGNFLFDQDWSPETTEGAILEATFHGARLAAVRLLPVRIENRLEPVFVQGAAGAGILRRIAEAARRLGE
jgi:poly-gamma-glutamate synthesis protein (capsule biosynthesis protein)